MRINASYGGWSGRCPGWHHLHPRLCCGDSVRGTGARRTRGGDHEASRRQGGTHGGGWPLPGGPHLVGSPTSSPCIVLLGRLASRRLYSGASLALWVSACSRSELSYRGCPSAGDSILPCSGFFATSEEALLR